jgi:AraC family cel operon transcriptional repressor
MDGISRQPMDAVFRQASEGWLDPAAQFRITGNEITWVKGGDFRTIRAGGDLFFHQVPHGGTVAHCHDFAEIVLINSGGLVHKVNHDRQKLVAGDLVFMRPDDTHAFLPDDSFDKVELVLLDFDLELFLSLSTYLENDVFLQQLTAPVLPPKFKLDPAMAGTLYTRLLKLNSPAISPVLRKIKVKILLGELYSRFFIDDSNLLSESQVPDWLENLCAEMRQKENFRGGVERMRKLACRTPGHLCKCFQKYLRRTPTDFVNELRLSHAACLLVDSHKQIMDIADELNFQSLSHFYHAFKKYYGMPPLAYRKLHVGARSF